MDKQSQEYSKSIAGTYGNFYPRIGNFRSMAHLDKVVAEGNITMQEVGNIRKILARVNADFSHLKLLTDKSTRRHAYQLFAKHYIEAIEVTPWSDPRIKTLMQNFVATKRKIALK